MSIGCSLESSESVACVYVAPIDVGGTSLVTVSETGDATVFEVSISAPTQAATSGSNPSSGSGSRAPPSTGSISTPTQAATNGNSASLGSSSGAGATSSTGSASGGKNGAEQVGPRFLGLIAAGLSVVVFLVL